jgi:hypothetical protein
VRAGYVMKITIREWGMLHRSCLMRCERRRMLCAMHWRTPRDFSGETDLWNTVR